MYDIAYKIKRIPDITLNHMLAHVHGFTGINNVEGCLCKNDISD